MAAKVIKIEIPIETQDKTDPALGSVTAKMEDLDNAAKNAQKSMDSASKSASGFEKSLGKSMDNVSKKASGFEKSLGSVTKQKWQILLEAKDKITPTVKQAITYVKSLSSKAWRVTLKAVDLVTSPVKRVFGLLKSPLVAAGVTISAGAGIASTVKTYAEFEAAMSQVKAISGATGEEFTQLTEKAKQMGATTKFTAAQSAEAFNYMAMAGWKASDMMSGIEGIMNLAAASGEDLGTTSDIVTDALTAFNLKASDSTHFADVLAQASANANTNVSKMGQTFQYVAPVAGAMGYSIEDTALAIGLMANAGIKGEKAGTALRSIFTRLSDPPSDAAEAIEKLGLSITNTDGSMRPLNDVMKDLRKSFAGLTQEQKVQMASQLAGQEAMSGLLALVNASEEDYNKLAEAIGNADGASKKMADTMLDNLSGKWTLFKSALDGVKISLGERFKPYLMDALDWMIEKMPDIEDTLLLTMDRIDEFVDHTKEKISEFTGTKEWQDADLFGKIKIGWDKLIAEPFSEWWDSSGKQKIMLKAEDIGKGLGSGISAGILTLLGIDVGSTIDEGATIGRQFASGFVSGFNASEIQSAIGSAISGIFKNAGKIFTGDADLSSWLSAALVAKVATPLLGAGIKGVKLGKTIFGSGEGGLGLGSAIIGSAAAGTGLKGLGASAGMFGLKIGSTATTGAGLIASGAAAAGGGVVGGATLISGGIDAYHAIKSDEAAEKKAYGTSAGLKVGGVAGGAALGAAIGSVIPGLGTVVGGLIGAGIGGIAGWFGGNKVKEDYEETKQAAEEAAAAAELMEQKSKYALEGSRFENSKLKDAFNDTTVSAERFASMMQEAASKKVQDSFGNIKLSVKEIKDAAKQIVFGDQEQAFTKFSSAASDAQNSLANLQSSVSTMDKLNWKASLGMKFDDNEISEYIAGVDNMLSSASQYLEDKHYQAKAAIDLLVEPGNETDMTTGLNAMYADMQSKIESLSAALSSAESIDTTGFATALQSSIAGSVQGLDYSGVTSAVGTGISNAITATMGTIQGAISTLYSDVGAAINSAFAAGFTTTTTVTITVNYKLANPTATISFSGGGSGSATVSGSIASNANGGFSYGPELTWWGEDGPEVIIPLGSKRRRRGLELWAQAGQILGIPQHAEGGMIGNPASAATYYDYTAQNAIQAISEEDSDTSEPIPTSVRHEGESGTKEVKLNVNVNPQFVISGGGGQSDEDIMRIIKSHFKELADDLGGELADRLGEVFSNMPVNA